MINYYLLFSLLARIVTLILLAVYVIPRQYHEIRRLPDQFSKLRWYVFYLIIAFLLASSPVIIYQYFTLAITQKGLHNVATVASGLSSLAVGIVLVLIYNYKYEE